MQLLLHLAENGHTCFVQELLKYPLQNGSDVLTLNLLSTGSSSHLAQELLSNLFAVFLSESWAAGFGQSCSRDTSWHCDRLSMLCTITKMVSTTIRCQFRSFGVRYL